jgi:hypothetical protein
MVDLPRDFFDSIDGILDSGAFQAAPIGWLTATTRKKCSLIQDDTPIFFINCHYTGFKLG